MSVNMKREHLAKLIRIEPINRDTSVLTLYCPDIAGSAKPGQFVQLSCGQFLKRPFGIASVHCEEGLFSVGVRRVGKGTAELLASQPGDLFDVLGPLGNTFPIQTSKKLLLVGGGTGIFPLRFAREYAMRKGIKNYTVTGYRCVADACFIDDDDPNCIVSTDIGDYGIKGNVVDVLRSLPPDHYEDATILTVGPDIMMKKVSEWAMEKNLPCFVSLERAMACGIGVCLVCTCKIKAENEEGFEHKRCCADGPVFNSTEVIW